MLTLIVWTVLTGTRAIAIEEKMCPAIWNPDMTRVPSSAFLVGFLIPQPEAACIWLTDSALE